MDDDDTTDIRRCQAGHRDAYRGLVERYQRQAMGHALTLLGQREDALDAVQEAFCDAYRALPRFDLSRRFYPWFYVMLRNRCYRLLTRSRRPAPASEPLLETASDVDLEALELALGALDAEDRELITLKHLDGLTYDALAERLGIPAGTVMSRLYHARRRLRAQLTRHPSFADWAEEAR